MVDPQNFVPTPEGRLDTKNTNFLTNISRAVLNLNPGELVIGATTGLEYLPRKIADERLHQIHSIVSSLKEGTQ